ncbi:hypothetical protein BDV36DRAFT_298031 [Aspergillus pseudocaelatus]|uniref:Uncharacterized protein n=1 Tax=Aspergillus pseudocaelatus TaxID=1825620 RepID=A0ABQ6WGZ3_9EURO|nr:hypothetical protein BDV36DRAFT_298031 [Aspergillus pseudocaelatus]
MQQLTSLDAKPDQNILTKDERMQHYICILNEMGDVLLGKGAVAAATDIFFHILDSQRGVSARSLLEDVIAIYTERWGRRHPDTMRAVDELALVFMEEGEHKLAIGACAAMEVQSVEHLWKEVLDFYGNTYGNHFDMAGRIKADLQCLYSSKLGLRQA